MNIQDFYKGLIDGKAFSCHGRNCKEIKRKSKKANATYDNLLEFYMDWWEKNRKYIVWLDDSNIIHVKRRWL